MLLLQIILMAITWRLGWRWKSLLPIIIGIIIAIILNVVMITVGLFEYATQMSYIVDFLIILSFAIMIVLKYTEDVRKSTKLN